jgi:hypothetical protein
MIEDATIRNTIGAGFAFSDSVLATLMPVQRPQERE